MDEERKVYSLTITLYSIALKYQTIRCFHFPPQEPTRITDLLGKPFIKLTCNQQSIDYHKFSNIELYLPRRFHLGKLRRFIRDTHLKIFGQFNFHKSVFRIVMSVLYEFFFVFTACKICNIYHTALSAKEDHQMHSIQKQTRLINCDGCSCICTLVIFKIITI